MHKLTYIYHDCFLLEENDCIMIFDFWKNPLSNENQSGEVLSDLPADKPLYVFVSHFHKDHFNKEIFNWVNNHKNIKFIISADVAQHMRYLLHPDSNYSGKKVDMDKVVIMRKGDIYEDDILRVTAFGSTDIGNSYAITKKSDGFNIFHAGDLNCWVWRDESTPSEIKSAENAFRSELEPIAGAYDNFDIVMFPVDSRIGSGYFQGALEFLRKIPSKRFFPMHFTLGDSAEEIEQRRKDALRFDLYSFGAGEFIGLTSPGDSYICADRNVHDCDKQLYIDSNVEYDLREYRERFFVSAGDCNAEKELAITTLVARIIEIATVHANKLRIGNPFMPDNHSGWVLSRLTLEMDRYPAADTFYCITTWVEDWNRHFSVRDFSIEDEDGSVMGYCRSIWMVLDTLTRANAGLSSLQFDKKMISDKQCPIRKQDKHLQIVRKDEYDNASTNNILCATNDPVEYRIQFCDLDAYRHVNTVRYISLLLNQYSLEEYDSYRVSRMELSFLHEAAYGMNVEILRSRIEDNLNVGNASSENSEPEKFTDAILLRNKMDLSPILYSRFTLLSRQE